MWTLLLLPALSVTQAAGDGAPRDPRDRLTEVVRRASREADLDGAGLVLSTLLGDEPALRSAFTNPASLDERSLYVLLKGDWGSRAKVAWKADQARRRLLVGVVAAKLELIRSVLRADRYATYFSTRQPRGTSTVNSFPFFEYSRYADDLAEFFIETLRRDSTHRAEAIRSPYNDQIVLITAEDGELSQLETWQMTCGLCGRPDLIKGGAADDWRGRFARLDEWFWRNRPYLVWDEGASCLRLDAEAKKLARPTRRSSRGIPELRPPWLPSGRQAEPPARREGGESGAGKPSALTVPSPEQSASCGVLMVPSGPRGSAGARVLRE